MKERYGNEQVFISAHMESILKISKIKSKENVKGLRMLYNHIETYLRDLKALKLDSASYGSLLIPILKDQLPDEINMIISRQFGGSVWTLDKVMEYFNNALRVQENCAQSSQVSSIVGQTREYLLPVGFATKKFIFHPSALLLQIPCPVRPYFVGKGDVLSAWISVIVHSVKMCLKKVLGKAFVTFEELQTILCEIEAVINSRPLTYACEDGLDEILTPFNCDST